MVINKIDVTRLSDLPVDSRAMIDEIVAAPPEGSSGSVHLVQMSCHSDEGVADLKTQACDALLAHRVENKMSGNKINTVINRIHVAMPKARDDIERAPCIPDAVKARRPYDKNDPDRPRLLRDIELAEGGAGVYNLNMKGVCFALSATAITDMVLIRGLHARKP